MLDYTPVLTFYSNKEFKESLSHSVALTGGAVYNDWAFSLSQTYATSSQSLIETGRQTDQESFSTSIGASHHLNSKLMLQLTFSQNINSAEEFTSSRSWSTMEWLNYQLGPRISIGAGVGGGYEDVNVGSDMINEQLRARLDARIAQKLNLSINGGGEIRQIIGVGGDPLINPVYGLSVLYQPFTYTTIALSGNRSVSASLFQAQITESTDISLALSQRLFGRLSSGLSFGFRNSQYITSDSVQALSREDDSFTFGANLGYGFLKRGSIGLSYSFVKNISSDTTFATTSSQVGLNIGYSF